MRYTTIIDITELPSIYRNHNARLLYLHLVLKCGYHDADRDMTDTSIRQLSAAVGLTIAATRHALLQLQAVGLLTREGRVWTVRKYVAQSPISARAKTTRQAQQRAEARQREAEELEAEKKREQETRKWQKLRAQGKTPFMVYYEQMMKAAAAGDMEAAEIVRKRRQAYEDQRAAIEKELKANEHDT